MPHTAPKKHHIDFLENEIFMQGVSEVIRLFSSSEMPSDDEVKFLGVVTQKKIYPDVDDSQKMSSSLALSTMCNHRR